MAAIATEARRDDAVPRHVAVIMDGNGRWARRLALPRQAGHRAGIKPVRAIVERCAEVGVEVLTLFAFSSENWRRPPDEVSALMSLFVDALNREVDELHSNGIRLRFIGALDSLATPLRNAIEAAERRTENNRRMDLVIAVAYGGRWDLAQAAKRLAQRVAEGALRPDEIDEAVFGAALETAGFPSVDLLIRTGGEKRISNFLLWELAYSEVYFCDVLWPAFTLGDLERAIDFYANRQRRFGRTGEQIEAARC